ncbi:class I tRNA ligase family protein [Ignicoccus hospitalis]|uniref:leucine--tRNA ligase n=1 Tax=Ignicoccus hospitalis (strain KIN4/I / DSM 18386 / JCM 14125) TaxID=453591 RepID=A8AB16_IGNH4|nr:class I tRNA ligase family protein [Ignicoccus hospitalis]ABU82118.1 leucyl-tRNA synthetase [Ignicoccus hospitalis KIN4/I]HIH91076.1 class I tRNA ligase family protein [Desulfurococcaceae archaeon]
MQQKFFVTAAFPYALPLDVDELVTRVRSYLVADVYARYHEARGRRVLFPMAFHYSGTPLVSFYERVKSRSPEALKLLKELGVPEDVKSPKELGDFMSRKLKELFDSLRLRIDWEHSFTTEDPGFKSFVKWIYLKLKEKGLVVKGTYPVPWDPVEEVPVSSHDTEGFKQIKVGSFFLLMFELSPGLYLPAAARPETSFGITNIWINPKAEYKIVEAGGKRMIMSSKAAFKIRFQLDEVFEVGKVDPEEILGKRAVNPITGESVPVLPSSSVDPERGSGVVASKPAHDVNDYREVQKLLSKPFVLESFDVDPKELEPKAVIELPGCEVPAACFEDNRELVLAERSKGKLKPEAVLKALKGSEDQFLKGLLLTVLTERPVAEVSEVIKRAATVGGVALEFYDVLNGPIRSRFGNEVVVKVLKDQWFLNYDDEKWKKKALEVLSLMEVVPKEVSRSLVTVIESLKKRAFALARGLGTPLPWDENLVIDSLSDSTLYYLFYLFADVLKDKEVKPEAWDYLILGEGKAEDLKYLRKRFLEWMPLDMRVVHEELVSNHVAYMLFHHAAIFGTSNVPRKLLVTGEVEGVSVNPFKEDPQALRLYLLTAAKPTSPLKFSEKDLREVQKRIEEILKEWPSGDREAGELEEWLESALALRVQRAEAALEQGDVREAALQALGFLKDLRRYYQRLEDKGLPPSKEVRRLLREWGSLLYPFAPSLAEALGGVPRWPSLERNLEVEAKEAYFDMLLNEIKKVKSDKVLVEVAPREATEALREVVESVEEGVWEELEDVPRQLLERALKLSEEWRELLYYIKDEYEMASSLKEELERRTGKEVHVKVGDAQPLSPKVRGL